MSDVFNLIVSQPFLQKALIVGVLISLCAALLGVSLVLKRFSMIGDGLSHVGFGAMAIASAANIAPLYFSLPIVVFSAFLLLSMSEKGKIKGDAAIALISTGALAAGVMVTSMTSGMNVDIYNYMFGSILTMSDSDVAISAVLSVVIISLSVVLYHEIFAVTFDESFARATGSKVSVYNMIIAALTAVTIVIGMRMMGALLISSLIIFPTVISMRLCKSYKGVVICSVCVSVFSFICGLMLSIRHEAPTGASVVIVNVIVLCVFSLIRAIDKINPKNKLYSLKKFFKVSVAIVFCGAFVLLFTAGNASIYTKEKLTVVATGFAPYDFARQIAGDEAEVIMLLAPGEESHTFEPTPKDIITIEQCDLFVYGGGESESWVETVLDGTERQMHTVKMMECVELYCEHTDDEIGHEHSHEVESHEEYDEHVWTSPVNAIKISEAICDALCSVDEKNTEKYLENSRIYIEQLKELDKGFSMLHDTKSRDCIVVGDRFPLRYLTEEYSIGCYAAFPGCSASVEANPVTIALLCDKIQKESIPYVFKVDLSSGNVAYSISEQTGAEVETLYSCHVISYDDYSNGETYISLMKRNLQAMKNALE